MTVTLGVHPAPPVEVEAGPGGVEGLTVADLIRVGRRHNPRRQVLFVSTVLGKHLNVAPATLLAAGMALGARVEAVLAGTDPSLDEDRLRRAVAGQVPTVDDVAPRPQPAVAANVVGFAETATALGHAVRRRLGPGPLTHTTRRPTGEPIVRCVEAHSHATEHEVHHSEPTFLADGDPVVIVDDEMTTGSTALGLIEAIHTHHPHDRYVLASLVDWRGDDDRLRAEATATRLGTRIDSVSLLPADATVGDGGPVPTTVEMPPSPVLPRTTTTVVDVGPPTARCGWSLAHQRTVDERVAEAVAPLRHRRRGGRALVLGTEELMYVPALVGLHLGDGVVTRSTTRSPIVAVDVDGYPIVDRSTFASLDGLPGDRHLYGLTLDAEAGLEDVVLVADVPVPDDHPLVAALGAITDHLQILELR